MKFIAREHDYACCRSLGLKTFQPYRNTFLASMSRIRTDDFRSTRWCTVTSDTWIESRAETLECKVNAKQFSLIILDSFWVIDSHHWLILTACKPEVWCGTPPTGASPALVKPRKERQWCFLMAGESTVQRVLELAIVKTGCTHRMMWILGGMRTVLIDMLLKFPKAFKNTFEFSKTSFLFQYVQDWFY